MCTSFIDRRNDIITAMNFDNNGMIFSLNLKNPQIFMVCIKDENNGRNYPSFGVNSNGTFINSLLVDSNGKGLYKRGKNTVNAVKLVQNILTGNMGGMNDLGRYIESVEIVNVPNISVHCMITDKNGNAYVIEPGRGNIYSPFNESPYFIMTNFSLIDNRTDNSCCRYSETEKLLQKEKSPDVNSALRILERVKQEEEWKTEFSMVYSQKENKVYYCYNADFKNILEYKF
ncbi:hypothetical protein K7I13_11850 [Brucepastera parasyntrophica]|uniref:hypothetical protein n=1 Tax=Brucepastera parasyntrophica TaxID=2880008 RepID=UPI00210DDF5F|nr:hypothetical protein [Brucepastera parasyntrophica]ULQ59182.1 hypothetical protein K7I13_11850 [Brucepastera parasyntrophica]